MMCKALNQNYDILVKRNHKNLLVNKFHRFLNIAITTVLDDRETNDIFVAASVAA